MSKVTLSTVESGFLSQAALNSNFDTIENELQNKVLYRDNPTGEPNSMQQDLDMNGHRILNILAEGGDGFIWKQAWNDGLEYKVNNIVYVPSGLYEGYAMICREEHTSSPLFQTDYDAGKWEILASRGASGSGSGDLVAANNLSDVASASAALNNLNGMPKTGGTFTGDIVVPDEAYDATSWNGNNEVPTKNSIRDKFESLSNPSIVNATTDPTFSSVSDTDATSPEWSIARVGTNLESSVAATGTSVTFTGIPSYVKEIKLSLVGVSSNGSSNYLVQLGTASGIETSTYSGGANNPPGAASTNFSTGFTIVIGSSSSASFTGTTLLHLINTSSNSWESFGIVSRTDTSGVTNHSGVKNLSGSLTQVRLTTANGTDAFDSGTVVLSWRG